MTPQVAPLTVEKMVLVEDLQLDLLCQQRAEEGDAYGRKLEEYAQLWKDGTVFDPIEVVFDGRRYWVWDGFIRTNAAKKASVEEIKARVRQGSWLDAFRLSLGANAGLRREPADIRRAVMNAVAVRREKGLEGSGEWSDRKLADAIRIGHSTFSKYVAELKRQEDEELSETDNSNNGSRPRPNSAAAHYSPPPSPRYTPNLAQAEQDGAEAGEGVKDALADDPKCKNGDPRAEHRDGVALALDRLTYHAAALDTKLLDRPFDPPAPTLRAVVAGLWRLVRSARK